MFCFCTKREGVDLCVIHQLFAVFIQIDAVVGGYTIFINRQTIADCNAIFLCFFLLA